MQDSIRVVRLIEPGRPLMPGTAPMPVAGPKDVLVKVKACNLVPNVANIIGGNSGMLLQRLPAIFGLDVAGKIHSIGSQVVNLQVGTRVYVNPLITCETCHDCRRGRQDLCAHGALRGYMTWSPLGRTLLEQYPYGGLSEFVVSPHTKIAPLADTIDYATASRFGYLGTSYAALKKAGFYPGCSLLINGVTGTLGVGAVLLALGMGAKRIVGVGRRPELLAAVKALAPGRIDVIEQGTGDLVSRIRGFNGGRGLESMYDCTGFGAEARLTNELLKAVADGGCCVVVGGGVSGNLEQSYLNTLIHDVRVVGSMWFNEREIDELIELVACRVVDLSSWETRCFRFHEIDAALSAVASRPGGFVNVVVKP